MESDIKVIHKHESCCPPKDEFFTNENLKLQALNIKYQKQEFDMKTTGFPNNYHSFSYIASEPSRFITHNEKIMMSSAANKFMFFCYWFPKLFGIDEELMPSSDDEGLLDEICNNQELDKEARQLSDSDLNYLKIKSSESITTSELRFRWKKNKVPMYGRRARPKPMLEKENQEKYECLCNIDKHFSRHYVPHFRGELATDEELRTPHFVTWWENYKEKLARTPDMDDWAKVIEPKPQKETSPDEKGLLFRPMPKLHSSCRSEIKNFRQQLLGSFRPLECREIRRFRMPFSEALYLELQEDRYFDSAQFFKNLIIKDYFTSKSPDYVPTLTENKGRMKQLVQFLKIAEKFSKRKEYDKEAITLIKSGKYFNDHNDIWWWVAEELYKKAVEVSKKSVTDGGKSEAISRYVLGTFLLECVNKVQLAQEHLSKARELSLGKNWNAESILGKKQEPVHQECSNYLCQALIASSKELRKNNKPEQALPLIHSSYKLCLESRTFRRDIEMETYFELGMTYQAIGMLDWAKLAFKKFIEIAKLENYPRSVCDGYLQLAITYRNENDFTRCHHSLMGYLETAEAYKDENMIALANRYLGEYHLNNGNSKIAAGFFKSSFESFLKQCNESSKIPLNWWKPEYYTLPHDVELTRVFLGLANGETITKRICYMILQSKGDTSKSETLKLINFKNKRENIVEEANASENEFCPLMLDSSEKGCFDSILNHLSYDGRKNYSEDDETNTKSVRFADEDIEMMPDKGLE